MLFILLHCSLEFGKPSLKLGKLDVGLTKSLVGFQNFFFGAPRYGELEAVKQHWDKVGLKGRWSGEGM